MTRCMTGSTLTRAQLGEQRCFWSMRIYEALKRNGYTLAVLARELGMTTSAVGATIRGKNHSAKVLDHLRALGVNEKYLFDPRRVDATGKEAA